jgi:hypothetical protein
MSGTRAALARRSFCRRTKTWPPRRRQRNETTKHTKHTKNQGVTGILSSTQRETLDRGRNELDPLCFVCLVYFVVHLNGRFNMRISMSGIHPARAAE